MPLYSPSQENFYIPGLHSNIPKDVIEVSGDEMSRLLDGRSAGKLIALRSPGQLMLVDPPPPTVEQLAAWERAWRDGELLALMWIRDRHRDQLEIGVDTTLAPEQFVELLTYMQALRDWPQSEQFPVIEHRPVAPPWLAEQTQ